MGKKQRFQSFKGFSCRKEKYPIILSTFEWWFSKKKMGKTPSSHIIHSLGGKYC